MSTIHPLHQGDPIRLGDYALRGRLAHSGRSTVYAGETESGERVEVTLHHVELSDTDAFLDDIEKLRRLPGFYAVAVLDAGTVDGRPYIVTQHVEGRSLEEEIVEHGPLTGPALHRLAVGTVTALVAMHQAGVTHGAMRPQHVLIGPDGPQVASAGTGLIMEVAATAATQWVESPAYLTPEQVTGGPAGPPGDLFAWAATMVYAATGRAPFEAPTMAMTMNRIRSDEPDLSMLDEPLRGLIAACLAKDPAERPTAGDALLKLVGHSLLTGRHEPLPPAEAEPATTPPRRGGFWLPLVAAGLGMALLGAGGGYALAVAARPEPVAVSPTGDAASATPGAGPGFGATPSVEVLEAMADPPAPPKPTKTVKAPGAQLTLHEHPDDPVRLTAYRLGKDTYLRTPGTDEFVKHPVPNADPALSPDGTMLALLADGTVTFHDQRTAAESTVTPELPESMGADVFLERPVWSRDGSRLLLTASIKGDPPQPTGFVIVDPATRTATVVDTTDEAEKGDFNYAWLPDGTGVAIGYQNANGGGVRFRDLQGRKVRDLHWIGESLGRNMFSPSGDLIVTLCPSGGTLCVWDRVSGVRRASIGIFYEGSGFFGWYDEAHLINIDPREKTHKLTTLDMRGRERRVLAEIAAADNKNDTRLIFTRS